MFETDPLHFHVASYFYSHAYPHFTTLPYLFHHLHHRIPLLSALVPCIKRSTYRAINFISSYRSCHYSASFDTLTLDFYVYRQSSPSPTSNHSNHTHHAHYTHHVKKQSNQVSNHVKHQSNHISNHVKHQPGHISNHVK